jgi:hypothetical protein
MKCKNCPLTYIGQTGRAFRTRCNEHIREIRTNGRSSEFAQHMLNTAHNYSTTDQTMKILHRGGKGQMLNTLKTLTILTYILV